MTSMSKDIEEIARALLNYDGAVSFGPTEAAEMAQAAYSVMEKRIERLEETLRQVASRATAALNNESKPVENG